MKTFFLLIITIVLSSSLLAQNLKEKLTVSSMNYNKKNSFYIITFLEKAAFYKSPIKWGKCLHSSIKNKKQVEISYDPIKMLITGCNLSTFK